MKIQNAKIQICLFIKVAAVDNALTLQFYIYAENDLETIELKSKSFISKFYIEDFE